MSGEESIKGMGHRWETRNETTGQAYQQKGVKEQMSVP